MTFQIKENGRFLLLESKEIKLELNVLRGLALQSLTFKKILNQPLLRTLEQGFYNDIRLGSDFYSAHSVMEVPARHKITDLGFGKYIIKKTNGGLSITTEGPFGDGKLRKTFLLSARSDKVKIRYQFSFNKLPIATLRTAFLTLNPEVFDTKSLYYGCHNGGDDLELFYLKNSRDINFGQAISGLLSSQAVLGNTKGYLEFGDAEKKIIVQTQPSILSGLPMLHFLKIDDTFLMRFFYSLQEIDETSLLENEAKNRDLNFEILLHAESHDSI